MAGQAYAIEYVEEAWRDVQRLRVYDQRKIVAAIERDLRHGPTAETRVRIKRMVEPFWSHFRLRVDDFRVYYDVDEVGRVVHMGLMP